ncbi:MAG: hypothetical protein KF905_00230 [Flavobacteriales bacterium]|nr:hypothetical protein [Flavobacteriales bacterium]
MKKKTTILWLMKLALLIPLLIGFGLSKEAASQGNSSMGVLAVGCILGMSAVLWYKPKGTQESK